MEKFFFYVYSMRQDFKKETVDNLIMIAKNWANGVDISRFREDPFNEVGYSMNWYPYFNMDSDFSMVEVVNIYNFFINGKTNESLGCFSKHSSSTFPVKNMSNERSEDNPIYNYYYSSQFLRDGEINFSNDHRFRIFIARFIHHYTRSNELKNYFDSLPLMDVFNIFKRSFPDNMKINNTIALCESLRLNDKLYEISVSKSKELDGLRKECELLPEDFRVNDYLISLINTSLNGSYLSDFYALKEEISKNNNDKYDKAILLFESLFSGVHNYAYKNLFFIDIDNSLSKTQLDDNQYRFDRKIRQSLTIYALHHLGVRKTIELFRNILQCKAEGKNGITVNQFMGLVNNGGFETEIPFLEILLYEE